MAVRQRAPSVSSPMVGAVLGDSRFLILICEQLGFFFFFHGCFALGWGHFASVSGVSVRPPYSIYNGIYSPFLPRSSLCQLRPWYPLLPLFRCGRLGQLPARLVLFVSRKSWAYCDVPCSGCGAVFMTWYVLPPAASKAFHAFACGGSSCLLAVLLAPSPSLGLGVRAGSFSVFHLGLGF